MNPTHGALPLPVAYGSADVIDAVRIAPDWPGLALAASQIGVTLDAEALTRFAQYRDLLFQRNAEYNLTAIRDAEGIERKLFLDALAMFPALDRALDRAPRPIEGSQRLVDVGAGAGFPGIPLKIARPDLEVTLIDATAKKVRFLNEVIANLQLNDTRAFHGRAEEVGQEPAFREHYDIATARAVASLPVLLEYVVPILKVGGTALLPKGLEIDEELRLGHLSAAALGAEIVSAERLPVAGTRLVVAVKVNRTPAAYPRRTGIPSRSPLGEGT